MDDVSPEELRYEAYTARAANTMDQHVNKVKGLEEDATAVDEGGEVRERGHVEERARAGVRDAAEPHNHPLAAEAATRGGAADGARAG